MISVVESIKAGEMDQVLDQVINAVQLRRHFLASKLVLDLNHGDKVRLKNIKPKYLSGCEAVVMGFKNSRIKVVLSNPPLGCKWGDGEITVHRGCIEKV